MPANETTDYGGSCSAHHSSGLLVCDWRQCLRRDSLYRRSKTPRWSCNSWRLRQRCHRVIQHRPMGSGTPHDTKARDMMSDYYLGELITVPGMEASAAGEMAVSSDTNPINLGCRRCDRRLWEWWHFCLNWLRWRWGNCWNNCRSFSQEFS